jgi:AraC-like DNA-binding protein
VVVLDPSASGSLDVTAVIDLLRKHPSVPFLAYVSLAPHNLKAVATLSRHGLADVIVHPVDDRVLCATVEACSKTRLVGGLLGMLEIAIAKLSPSVCRAVQDLFKRPNRYETGADIAISAGIGVKSVYRDFQAAHLGTPKKMVTVAKLLYGYSHLLNSRLSMAEISVKLGYSSPRIVADHSGKVFGCRLSSLRNASEDEVVMALLDWFYRPCGRRLGRREAHSSMHRGRARGL